MQFMNYKIIYDNMIWFMNINKKVWNTDVTGH